MPYIDQAARDKLDPAIDEILRLLPTDNDILCGELNYVVSRICWELCGYEPVKRPPYPFGVKRYARANTVRGAIENAVSEWYSRIVRPYEKEKILSAGDL